MELTEEHKYEFRRSIDKIHPLGIECWFEIEPFIHIKELDNTEYFSKEGQQIKELGFVYSGVLRIYYLNDKGEEWNKHFLQRNDFVAASISPEKKSITNIQALTKAIIVYMPYCEIVKLSQKYNEINVFIQKLAFSYLEEKEKREINLLTKRAMNNYLFFKEKYPELENKIQHYHIASYLGITPTQLSRIRKKMSTH